jgi:diketogulonate reductase-like aldo/keto reductase
MNRRQFLKLTSLGWLAASNLNAKSWPAPSYKIIPSSGEKIPMIGMGSFINFNVGNDAQILQQRTELLKNFFSLGGSVIDSSPMYGSSERNLGYCIDKLQPNDALFSATKVWTSSVADGPLEIEDSRNLWGVEQFDLLQVHNLLSWQGHLETLFDMKQKGTLRYVGVTTSHGRRHDDLEYIMQTQPIDFVQATYNILDREVEQRILPLAKEKGIAFIANRPFRRAALIDWAKQHPLPEFAKAINCENWAALLLKFIVSHPAVSCAIPATSRQDHLLENMGAMNGTMPDEAMRKLMIEYVASL